jgi:hypothetical protein
MADIRDQIVTTLIEGLAALQRRVDEVAAFKAVAGLQGERGEQGPPPSEDELRAAAERWLTANITQPADGEDGRDGLDGRDGERGPAPTSDEIALAVEAWFEINRASVRGADGRNGINGADGVAGARGADGPRGLTGAAGRDGADGVGIDFVEQRSDTTFTIVLTDEREFEVELPEPPRMSGGFGNVYDIDAFFNSLAFNLDPRPIEGKGILRWNPTEQTLDLGMDYNITQQIGQETYARVGNTTGVTIPKGTVVGFAGAENDALLVSPYLANGSQRSLYILGIMAHDLPDSGERGYCTTWGFIRGMNTSGFTAGDVLYASPTVIGGLTNIKPTAPNNVIPVAACIQCDPVDGVIFVRPTITQMQYYGIFAKTADQSPLAVNTAYVATFNDTEISNGVVIGTPASRIVVPESGLYQFAATVQITSGSSAAKNVWVWFRRNGVNYPNSARVVTSNINNGYIPVTLNEFFTLAAGDYVEIAFASDSINVTLDNVVATDFAPEAPAILLSVTQVQQ